MVSINCFIKRAKRSSLHTISVSWLRAAARPYPPTSRTSRSRVIARAAARHFGRAAAECAAEIVEPGASHGAVPPSATEAAVARLDRVRHAKGGTKTGALRRAMQRAMQHHCASSAPQMCSKKGCTR
jgi:hypothetical protein